MTAEIMNTASTAYLKFFIIHLEVIIPIRERKKTRVGSSNTIDIPRITRRARLKYLFAVRTASKSAPILRKKLQAKGKAMKYPKSAPRAKKRVVRITNGIKYFLSLRKRPGAINNHTWVKIKGAAKKIAARKETLI